MAGTVATVPTVKKAVHHVTAPRHVAKPVRRAANAPARPAAVAQQQVDCAPGGIGPLPAVPLVTYAAPIPDEPAGGGGFVPGAVGFPVIGGIGGGGGGGGIGDTPATPPVPGGPGPVPEPSIWLMMIAGVGALGAALRRQRRGTVAGGARGSARRAATGGALWSGSVAVEAGDMAATLAVKSTVASAAGKAMLCVCPAAIVAGSVMTVPPLRQAVHAATLPAEAVPPPAPLNAMQSPLPCIEPTIPVAASAVEGFPAAVETTAPVPASVAAPAPAVAAASAVAGAANDG